MYSQQQGLRKIFSLYWQSVLLLMLALKTYLTSWSSPSLCIHDIVKYQTVILTNISAWCEIPSHMLCQKAVEIWLSFCNIRWLSDTFRGLHNVLPYETSMGHFFFLKTLNDLLKICIHNTSYTTIQNSTITFVNNTLNANPHITPALPSPRNLEMLQ